MDSFTYAMLELKKPKVLKQFKFEPLLFIPPTPSLSCVRACVCGGCAMAYIQKSEDKLQDPILSFHHVGAGESDSGCQAGLAAGTLSQ